MSDKAQEFVSSLPENTKNEDFKVIQAEIASDLRKKLESLQVVGNNAPVEERAEAVEAIFGKELVTVTENLPVILERMSLAHEDLKGGMTRAHEKTFTYLKRGDDALLAFEAALLAYDPDKNLGDIHSLFGSTFELSEDSTRHTYRYGEVVKGLDNPTDLENPFSKGRTPYLPNRINTANNIVAQYEKQVDASVLALGQIKLTGEVTPNISPLKSSRMILESANTLFISSARGGIATNESIVADGAPIVSEVTALEDNLPQLVENYGKLHNFVQNLNASNVPESQRSSYLRLLDAAHVLNSLKLELENPDREDTLTGCGTTLEEYRNFANKASNFMNARHMRLQADLMLMKDATDFVEAKKDISPELIEDSVKLITNYSISVK